ncbi:hypothetical protein EVAR_94498_1 [Eumeta japonica]|uniref:Uncharacterized protein n=1 Tax=Eumeta variegata TaxID=151549 RepID=A0A4C1UVC6_EUMVA|nr:hypothetical protein EVAR_94498_1 [Eumeta japonica]
MPTRHILKKMQTVTSTRASSQTYRLRGRSSQIWLHPLSGLSPDSSQFLRHDMAAAPLVKATPSQRPDGQRPDLPLQRPHFIVP